VRRVSLRKSNGNGGMGKSYRIATFIHTTLKPSPKTSTGTTIRKRPRSAVAGDGFCYVSRPSAESAYNLASVLMDKLAANNGRVVGHNSWQFDIPRTHIAGLTTFPLGEDTMVLAYLEDETQPKGLESLCVKHLGVKGWKDEFEHPLGSEEFALYNARDAVYTLRLYRTSRGILGDRYLLSEQILRPAFVALSAMSSRGIYIDANAVARERAKAEIVLSSSLAKIRELTGSEKFNPGSSKQVAKYLLGLGFDLPFTINPKTKKQTKNRDTSVSILNEIGIPFTREVLEYRGAKKTIGTYCKNYEKIIAADGRVHPEYKIIRTLTGRSSAVNQNVQNLPREYKDFFGAPPGKVFCEVDWSAIEFRVAAWVAQESIILSVDFVRFD